MNNPTNEEKVVKSLKWIKFNLGETEINTFPNAIKIYVDNAITIIENQVDKQKAKNEVIISLVRSIVTSKLELISGPSDIIRTLNQLLCTEIGFVWIEAPYEAMISFSIKDDGYMIKVKS